MWIDSLREFGGRLANLVRRPQFESEMNDELQFHIDMQTEQWVSSGMSRDEARRKALLEFGGLEQTREHCRDTVGIRLALLLSPLGAVAGLLFALGGIEMLELIHTDATYLGVKEFRYDRLASVGIDRAVLSYTVVVSAATGVLFGLIPAVQASRLNVNEALKADSPSTTPGRATCFASPTCWVWKLGQ